MSLKSKKPNPRFQILAGLVKQVITDRFKRLAKDEVLSKFAAAQIDPALLVDHAFQAEREALELAEMSLLELVTSDRLDRELNVSSRRIQDALSKIYPEEVGAKYPSDALIRSRTRWLRSRIDFYSRWLSVETDAETPLELAIETFRSLKNFNAKLEPVLEADRIYAEDMTKATAILFRLLMKKQLDHELETSEEIWREFAMEAFKPTKSLPGT